MNFQVWTRDGITPGIARAKAGGGGNPIEKSGMIIVSLRGALLGVCLTQDVQKTPQILAAKVSLRVHSKSSGGPFLNSG